MSKRKKTLLIVTGLLICILAVGIVRAYFVYGIGQSDKKYVAHEYAKLPALQYLQFKNKQWDDVHAFDPSLRSVWDYGYTIQLGISPAIATQALRETLTSNGYTLTRTYDNRNYKDSIYEFQAHNNKISLEIVVGTALDSHGQEISGNGAGVSAERLPAYD